MDAQKLHAAAEAALQGGLSRAAGALPLVAQTPPPPPKPPPARKRKGTVAYVFTRPWRAWHTGATVPAFGAGVLRTLQMSGVIREADGPVPPAFDPWVGRNKAIKPAEVAK